MEEQAHVFISYVRNNRRRVDRLSNELTAHGVKVWLDREDIAPGVDWRQAIRRAIQQGAGFIACFSGQSNRRNQAFMNEELTLAIDELRQRPTDQSWFIPIKLNNCEIPDLDIGAGRTLQNLQYVELYPRRQDWNAGIKRIVDDAIQQFYISRIIPKIQNGEKLTVAYKRNPNSSGTSRNTFFDKLSSAARNAGDIITLDYDESVQSAMASSFTYVPSYNLAKLALRECAFSVSHRLLRQAINTYDARDFSTASNPWRAESGGGQFFAGIARSLDVPVVALLRYIEWKLEYEGEPSCVYAEDIPALKSGLSVVFDVSHESDWTIARNLFDYVVFDYVGR